MRAHLELLAAARREGLAVSHETNEHSQMTEWAVCTGDRHGLFAMIAGVFASQLVDVSAARLFTHPDGYALDAFTVCDARHRRPLTVRQCEEVVSIVKEVLLNDAEVQTHVDRARRRIFAL